MALFLGVGLRVPSVQKGIRFIYGFISNQFMVDLGTKKRVWFSFISTLFLFILFSNLTGLIPKSITPTGNINTTGALAVMIFLMCQVIGVWANGIAYFKSFVPSGIPWPLMILMVPIEIASQFSRPFSLAVRLFANMFAGHMVLTIFFGFVIVLTPLLKPLPFVGIMAVSLFEVFVACIQAFIFTYLAVVYLGEAMHPAH